MPPHQMSDPINDSATINTDESDMAPQVNNADLLLDGTNTDNCLEAALLPGVAATTGETYHLDGKSLSDFYGASDYCWPSEAAAQETALYGTGIQNHNTSYLIGQPLNEWNIQTQHIRSCEQLSRPDTDPCLELTPLSMPTTIFHASSAITTHWKSTYLDPLSAYLKQQPAGQKQAFCLWNNCSKPFKRRGDLDRHVQSVHLGLTCHCSVLGCDDNGGKGFSRQDKLKEHGRKVHGFP